MHIIESADWLLLTRAVFALPDQGERLGHDFFGAGEAAGADLLADESLDTTARAPVRQCRFTGLRTASPRITRRASIAPLVRISSKLSTE